MPHPAPLRCTATSTSTSTPKSRSAIPTLLAFLLSLSHHVPRSAGPPARSCVGESTYPYQTRSSSSGSHAAPLGLDGRRSSNPANEEGPAQAPATTRTSRRRGHATTKGEERTTSRGRPAPTFPRSSHSLPSSTHPPPIPDRGDRRVPQRTIPRPAAHRRLLAHRQRQDDHVHAPHPLRAGCGRAGRRRAAPAPRGRRRGEGAGRLGAGGGPDAHPRRVRRAGRAGAGRRAPPPPRVERRARAGQARRLGVRGHVSAQLG